MVDLSEIRKLVYNTNLELSKSDLVIQSFGNASQRISENNFVIKPSGVDLLKISYEEMSYVSTESKNVDEGLRPSSDTPTHKVIYEKSDYVGGIVHTHSQFATAFAQAMVEIKNYGTTHSDYSKNEIICTRPLTIEEVETSYEENTGLVIHEAITKNNLKYEKLPGILVANHGVFSWGKDIQEAFKNAEIIEYLAKMNLLTLNLNPSIKNIPDYLSDKHFDRKHGPESYYGQ